MNEHEPNAQLCMTFPCTFPLKVMGTNHEHFQNDMLKIVREHIPHFAEDDLTVRPSKSDKFLALTFTFTAQSKEELDNLYRELNSHPDVKMTL